MEIMVWPPGNLSWNGNTFRCALGRSGVGAEKKEGDGVTPVGRFPLRRVMYRSDRLEPPKTALEVLALGPGNGWCDDPEDESYNRLILLPFSGSHETLWRQDHVYDVIVELGYNDDPVKPGLSSAIFLHVAKPDYGPTEGCVALGLEDLLALLEQCGETAMLTVAPSPP
jgi:L,D-peptidoglycan transpeptidase YkuD (ErfK/YbiS/YcfS/YnhG family)